MDPLQYYSNITDQMCYCDQAFKQGDALQT